MSEKLPVTAARKLWSAYIGLVECIKGSIDSKSFTAAVALLAREAARARQRRERETREVQGSLGQRLNMGLNPGSSTWVAFSRSYLKPQTAGEWESGGVSAGSRGMIVCIPVAPSSPFLH